MGDWYGTAALLLAIGLFVAGVRFWESRGVPREPSPTPPLQPEIGLTSQVSELVTDLDPRQGRGPAREVHTSPTGMRGVWIRPGDDDDD